MEGGEQRGAGRRRAESVGMGGANGAEGEGERGRRGEGVKGRRGEGERIDWQEGGSEQRRKAGR